MTRIILFVAKGGLEVHAGTEPERIGIQHGLIVAQDMIGGGGRGVVGAIRAVGPFSSMRVVLIETMLSHRMGARSHGSRVVVAGDIGRGPDSRLMLVIDHVCLGIIFLFYGRLVPS